MNRSGRSSLRDLRFGVGAVVALLGLAIAGVLAFDLVSLRDLERSSNASDRALQIVTSTSQTEKLVIDLETGLRGYALTGQAGFLQPFEQARLALPGQERLLTRLLTAEHEPTILARGIEVAVTAYLRDYAEPLVRLAARDLAAVRSPARVDAGKGRVDAMRIQFGALLSAERRHARERRADAKRVAGRAEIAGFAGLAGLLVLLGLSGLYLARAVDRERRAGEREQEIARTLQLSLLPDRLPAAPGLALAARFQPAGGFVVGGDFYDVFPTPHGWIAVIGDIAGKGPQAARLTAVARYTLRNEAVHEHRPSRLLASANRSLRGVAGELALCTLACCALTRRGDGFELEVASAGHPLPLLLRADGTCTEVGGRGTILGLVEDPLLHDEALRLAPGDSLVLYTDGLTDAHAPRKAVPPAALAAALTPLAGRPPEQIAEQLEALAGELETARDDIAILVLQSSR